MIEVHALSKSFGPQRALVDVDLQAAPGECIMLAGPNGAGKTTLLHILATLSRPTSGQVRIFGLDPHREGHTIRRQIGFLSHRTLLYEDLSGEENLTFYARMYGLADGAARIAELLEQVDLAHRRHDLVATYSRGMQQRLAVARALLHRPRLLLLDEPFTGLDAQAAGLLGALLTGRAGAGCTLVFSAHQREDPRLPAQRLVVLHKGRVVEDTPLAPAAFPAGYGRAPTEIATGQVFRPDEARSPAPLRQVGAIVAKDLAAELHTREIIGAMFVFAVLALLSFSFALDMQGAAARAAAPGILWSAIVFTGILGLSRSMAREHQTGGLTGLRVAPVDRAALFFGKALGNLLLMLIVEVLLLPLGTLLFDVMLIRASLLGVLLLGTVGYAAVGTLLAALAANTRARELLLPVLLLPLVAPLLIAAVRAAGGLVSGLSWGEVNPWVRLLVVYDLVIVAVSMVAFEYVVQE